MRSKAVCVRRDICLLEREYMFDASGFRSGSGGNFTIDHFCKRTTCSCPGYKNSPLKVRRKVSQLSNKLSCMDFLVRMMATTCWLSHALYELLLHHQDSVVQISVFRSNVSSPYTKKILTSSWIPQNDLLAHPNTRMFVSHCGKNGQYEALFHAVPVVATPLFADQFYNAERMRVKGFAETVDLNTV
ncbi:hypothetical protein C0Q70_20875 [Pomacea canaliculata]|uniref:Glucuronosyltransferase n=1 Tax=Pomacea canaliculata TaxID=400727 RepID=A0A2T7NAX6_POMCA|nr:hypothetical protein C0Q70_20875 [Pomacea canaliculata]